MQLLKMDSVISPLTDVMQAKATCKLTAWVVSLSLNRSQLRQFVLNKPSMSKHYQS